MPTSLSLALSAALLAAAPSLPGDAGHGSPDMQVFAAVASVLGAATGCDKIDRKQVSAAAGEVGALATAKVLSVEEAVSIERVLIVSAAAGLQALKDGKTDCKTVEASFNQLQQLVLQTPVARPPLPQRPGERHRGGPGEAAARRSQRLSAAFTRRPL